MESRILENGMKAIYSKKNSNAVSVEVNVKAGSNNEDDCVAGISHFIEHMLFEGTASRPSSYKISNEIEKLGGELNAATSNERTFFYCKVAKKHAAVALDVVSDIIMNPLFDEALIEKEKGIVIDEIKLVNDQPRYYQWIMFEKALFRKHPAGRPIYGTIEAVNALNKKKILEYYRRHYIPNNMCIAVVGDVPDAFALIEEKFSAMKKGKIPPYRSIAEPKQSKDIVKKEKRKTAQAYSVLGFNTACRSHKDSYVLDVIRAVVGRGQSGKIFDEIRNKRGLAYDVGVYHNPSTDFGFFAVYVNTNEKNLEIVKKIIVDELRKLKDVSEKELKEAKTFLEGEFLLQSEDTQKQADLLAFWEQVSSEDSALNYIGKIKSVTRKDVSRVVDEYFRYHTIAVIH